MRRPRALRARLAKALEELTERRNFGLHCSSLSHESLTWTLDLPFGDIDREHIVH
jgi:hypothetical protein